MKKKTGNPLALLVCAFSASSLAPTFAWAVTLAASPESSGVRIGGIGWDVERPGLFSGIGDFDGDGRSDVALVSPDNVDGAYIATTRPEFGELDISELLAASGGVEISGIGLGGEYQVQVASAADVNGDGLGDLALLAVQIGVEDPALEAYVIFGSESGDDVSLAAIEAAGRGFRVDGLEAAEGAVPRIADAGDVNGDGLSDVVIGVDRVGQRNAGLAHVVFGKADPTPVNVQTAVTTGSGYSIQGANVNDRAGAMVGTAGDINGDGYDDIYVAALGWSNGGNFPRTGAVHVVYGYSDSQDVDLAGSPNEYGFLVEGSEDYDAFTVAGIGDVNGDGFSDLAIGERDGGDNTVSDWNRVFLLRGAATNPTRVDLRSVDVWYDYSGPLAGGLTVAAAGDLDADGFHDLMIGAPGHQSGAVYLIRGSDVLHSQTLNDATVLGWEADSVSADLGFDLAAAGDLNGDGFSDFVAASNGTPGGGCERGCLQAFYGRLPSVADATWASTIAPGDGWQAIGSAVLQPASRAWIRFPTATQPIITTASLSNRAPNGGSLSAANSATGIRHIFSNVGWQTAEVVFRYNDTEIEGLNEDRLRVYHAELGSGPWTVQPLLESSPERNEIIFAAADSGYFAIVDPDADYSAGATTLAATSEGTYVDIEVSRSVPEERVVFTVRPQGNRLLPAEVEIALEPGQMAQTARFFARDDLNLEPVWRDLSWDIEQDVNSGPGFRPPATVRVLDNDFLDLGYHHVGDVQEPSPASQLSSALLAARRIGHPVVVTLPSNSTLHLAASDLNVAKKTWFPAIKGDVTIDGQGGSVLERGGTAVFRFFRVLHQGSLTLKNISLIGGDADMLRGGAVYSLGQLRAEHCQFLESSARVGGALWSRGLLEITDCSFTGNVATRGGALANFAYASLASSSIAANLAQSGALFNAGVMLISDSVVEDNQTDDGAIVRGRVGLQGVTLRRNVAANCDRAATTNLGDNLDDDLSCIVKDVSIASMVLPDTGLAACVQDYADQRGWTRSNEVTSMRCVAYGIESLSGLQQMRKIRLLDISGNSNIADLSVLTSLPALETLIASGIGLAGLDDIPSAPLQKLNVKNNQLSDLVGLDRFPGIEELSVDRNQLVSLNGIETSTSLWYLSASNNQRLGDIDDLATIAGLRFLDLSYTSPESIQALEQLPLLEQLSLRHVGVDSLDSIAGLEHLSWLDIRGNRLESLSSIANLASGLEHLAAERNRHRIPCDDLALFAGVAQFTYDTWFDADRNRRRNVPPDQDCGPY